MNYAVKKGLKIALIVVSIIVAAALVAASVYGVYRFVDDSKNKFTQKELDEAVAAATEEGELYRAYLQTILDELENEIEKNDALTELNDLQTEYIAFIEETLSSLDAGNDFLLEVASQKVVSLTAMRDSLVSLRSSYINDRTSQQAQQQTINQQISELQNLGGLEGELQGFLLAKAYIDAQVENTNNIINQLAAQIAVLNQQIEELQSGIGS
jgi:hypothetical protein